MNKNIEVLTKQVIDTINVYWASPASLLPGPFVSASTWIVPTARHTIYINLMKFVFKKYVAINKIN